MFSGTSFFMSVFRERSVELLLFIFRVGDRVLHHLL